MNFINPERIPQKHRATVMANILANSPNDLMVADPDYDGDGETPKIKKHTDVEWINMKFMDVAKSWNKSGRDKLAAQAAVKIDDIWTD
jgi:hypothetical protein